MELEQLYYYITLVCKQEPSLPDFFFYYDMAVRRFLARYPKKLLLAHGEYKKPTSLSEGFALHERFDMPIIYFVGGSLAGYEQMVDDADRLADEIYLSLWKDAARGKRLKGDRW